MNFKFGLGAKVALSLSGEQGEVKGRAEYEKSQNSYFVRYVNGEGGQGEEWVSEDALVDAPATAS